MTENYLENTLIHLNLSNGAYEVIVIIGLTGTVHEK